MRINELNDNDILKYMAIYKTLKKKEKNDINYIVYKNHLMFLKKNDKIKYKYYYTYLDNFITNPYIKKENTKISSIEDILNLFNKLMKNSDDFFEASLTLNNILTSNGFCPLILYAFNNIIYTMPISYIKLKNIIEFSLMYLYKIIKLDNFNKTLNGKMISKNGAVSNIYLVDNKVIKAPKTLASKLFLMEQEYDAFEYLKNSELKEFLCENYHYNHKTKQLSHDYIAGYDGEYYLFQHIPLNNKQTESLKRFYLIYKKYYPNIILDIHPGNFVWDIIKKNWIIIDLGILPEIGKEYYDFKTFEEYYENIWIKREKTIKRIPIRSIDFDIDLNVKDKEVKCE